jgi:hypothetical protein
MFGIKKKNASNDTLNDETISDKSKFVLVGFYTLIASIILFIFLELFTSMKLSDQNNILEKNNGADNESRNVLIKIAKKGNEVKKINYEHIKEIMRLMSPKEFQEFKNNISGMANSFNVQINSLNEIKNEKLDIYEIYAIEYQFLSKYENFVQLKKKISETKFKINLFEENIERYSPESDKILAKGIIHAYVFIDKEKLLQDNKELIEKQKIIEEKEAKKKTELDN